MALYQVAPGDAGVAEDINQIVKALTGVSAETLTLNASSTLVLPDADALTWSGVGGIRLKTFSGSLLLSATAGITTSASIPHGLGRAPRVLFGYSAPSQASADAGFHIILYPPSNTNGEIAFSQSSTSTPADDTNVYLTGKSRGTAESRYYRFFVL